MLPHDLVQNRRLRLATAIDAGQSWSITQGPPAGGCWRVDMHGPMKMQDRCLNEETACGPRSARSPAAVLDGRLAEIMA
ncbi:MAG: hypothetical protein ABIJ57_08145 [Pseudomonadota bacterium]